jgi:hypothetical protein
MTLEVSHPKNPTLEPTPPTIYAVPEPLNNPIHIYLPPHHTSDDQTAATISPTLPIQPHNNNAKVRHAYDVSGVLADSVGVFAVTFNFFGSGLPTHIHVHTRSITASLQKLICHSNHTDHSLRNPKTAFHIHIQLHRTLVSS